MTEDFQDSSRQIEILLHELEELINKLKFPELYGGKVTSYVQAVHFLKAKLNKEVIYNLRRKFYQKMLEIFIQNIKESNEGIQNIRASRNIDEFLKFLLYYLIEILKEAYRQINQSADLETKKRIELFVRTNDLLNIYYNEKHYTDFFLLVGLGTFIDFLRELLKFTKGIERDLDSKKEVFLSGARFFATYLMKVGFNAATYLAKEADKPQNIFVAQGKSITLDFDKFAKIIEQEQMDERDMPGRNVFGICPAQVIIIKLMEYIWEILPKDLITSD